MQITLKVFRFNPEKDRRPHYDHFLVEGEETDRILDLLERVKGFQDGTLTFRRSCAHGMCGSDAMRINGRNALACKTLLRDLKTTQITVEPLLGLRVIKDLIVDMQPFFENYAKVKPCLCNDEPLPDDGKERLQSPEERQRFDDTTKCILCGACATACPAYWGEGNYLGPAAIVNAHRFIFDSRDRMASVRLEILNQSQGVWRCRTAYNCTEACPRDIQITQAIAEIKRAIMRGKLE